MHAKTIRACVGWTALLIFGQAASLAFIRAGTTIGYQHFVAPSAFLQQPLAVGAALLQFVLVAWGLARQRARARSVLAAVPSWLLVGVALFVVVASVAPSADPTRYAVELLVGGAFRVVALANVLLIGLAVPPSLSDRLAVFVREDPGGTPRIDRFGLSLVLGVTAVCALLAFFVYERHPHLPDELSYVYQARYFAEGQLDMPSPPVASAFDVDLMSYEPDRWYSPVPPGWPAVLAVGERFGVGWLVNPLLAGLGVLLTYLLAWRLFGRTTGMLAASLLAVSPWYLFIGMSFMTHHASFVFATGAADLVVRWRDSRRMASLLGAGALLGAVGLVRPLEAVAVGMVLGIAVLAAARGRGLVPSAAAFGLSALAVSSVVLPFNAEFTGSATEFPIMTYAADLYGPNANALGFGPDRGLGWTGLDPFPGHGARDVVVNQALNTHAIDVEMFGWAVGAWGLLLLVFLARRPQGAEWWAIAWLVAPMAVHVFYYFAGGPDFGARYWFLCVLPLAVLTARTVTREDRPGVAPAMVVGMMALVLAAATTFMPWRAVDKYQGYRGMRPWARAIVADASMADALVLVRGVRQPDYANAAFYNPLDLVDDGPIFAWDLGGAVRDSLLDFYADRPVYVLEEPESWGAKPEVRRFERGEVDIDQPGSLRPEPR